MGNLKKQQSVFDRARQNLRTVLAFATGAALGVLGKTVLDMYNNSGVAAPSDVKEADRPVSTPKSLAGNPRQGEYTVIPGEEGKPSLVVRIPPSARLIL